LDNDVAQNLRCIMKGVYSAQDLGPSLELCNALSMMIPLMSGFGYHRYAEKFSEQAVKMSQELQNKEAIAVCNQARSLHLAAKGQLAAGEAILKEALKLCEMIGDTRLWNETNALLTATLHASGKFKEEAQRARYGERSERGERSEGSGARGAERSEHVGGAQGGQRE
jgi:hypothetical protein